MTKRRPDPKIETRLSADDMDRLNRFAAVSKRSKAELAREAIRWYLNNQEELGGKKRESELAQSIMHATDALVRGINGGVDRICKMLARQGRAIGTLYELSWMSLPDDENARKAFEAAATRAKQKMARHVETDEKEFAERLKKVVNN